jgi:hypothetical protein
MTTKRVTTEVYGRTDEKVVQDVEVFEVEPAYIRVNVGVTKNLGNYESLRVDASISVPCYKELIAQTFESVASTVNTLLADEVDRYLSEQ